MSLRAAAPALLAALLFGASTPLAKLLGLTMAPQFLARLLYLGSGLGLAVLIFVWDGHEPHVHAHHHAALAHSHANDPDLHHQHRD